MGCGASHAESGSVPNASSKTNDNTNTSTSTQKQNQSPNDHDDYQDSPAVSTKQVEISDENEKKSNEPENRSGNEAVVHQSVYEEVCPSLVIYR